MSIQRAASSWLVALSLLAGPLAGAAEAPLPTDVDREIPPDRGRRFLLPKDLRRQLFRLSRNTTPIPQRIEIIGVLALTREFHGVPVLVKLVVGELKLPLFDPSHSRRTRNYPFHDILGQMRGRAPIEVRVAALWALGEIGDPAGMPAYQRALVGIYFDDPRWRYAPGIAIGETGKTISLEHLCSQQLGRLAQPMVSKLAEFVLGPVTEPPATTAAPLKGHRPEKPDDASRRAALISLAAVGDNDSRAVKTLCDVLRANDQYYPWDYKIIAAQSLSALVRRRRAEFAAASARIKVLDKMAEGIADAFTEAAIITELPEIREIVGWTLRDLGWADRAAATLSEVLAVPNIPKTVRYRAIEALAFLQSKASIKELILGIHSLDRNERWRAAIALASSAKTPAEREKALAAIRKLTHDPEEFVRVKACAALGHLQDPKALPVLAVAVTDAKLRVRRQATLALGRIGDPAAIATLVRALEDSSPSVRARAVISLGYIARAEGIKALPAMMKDKSPVVRLIAVRVLDRFLNPGVAHAIVHALGDADKLVHEAAHGAILARLHERPDEIVSLLCRAVAKAKGGVRAGAAALLDADYRKAKNPTSKRAKLYHRLLREGDRPLAKALLDALDDPTPATRSSAATIMVDVAWRHKDKEMLRRLAALKDDGDRKVRNVGYRALNWLRNLR